jgi:Spy/CpxP family protein refolding chaperone
VKTRLSVIGIAVLLATMWTPSPRAAAPVASTAAPQAQQARPDSQSRGNSQRRAPWWKDAETMAEIGISADQSKKIDDLFHKGLPEAMAHDRELKKQEAELHRLIKERTVGADVIAVQVDRVEAQRTTLNKRRTVMLYQMYQLLSAEQYAKLVAFNERRRNNGRGNSFR